MQTNSKERSDSYSQAAKATGIFGGVQAINVLIQIVRSKVVAVLLGTTGVGIQGLFSASTGMIASITNLSLGFSAVRSISEASGTNDWHKVSRFIFVLRRWVYFTGIFGMLLTILLSPKLSYWAFGNYKYTWAFIFLSIILLLQALNSGQLALLQGLRKLKYLAKATLTGSFFGLCISIPLYFWFGIAGIVPSIILTAGLSLALSWYFSRQIRIDKVQMSLKESFFAGLDMVKLGSVMMVTGFIQTGVIYLIRAYISRTGGIEQVGLYTAAFGIVNGYVGLVFTAMGTDYFPRLSAVNHDNSHVRRLVNEQAEIAIILLGPILIMLLSTLPLVIRILLSAKFLPIIALVQWALLGVLFKAASWSIAFIILAKGDGKIYLITETTGFLVILASNIVFYHFFKLEGLGFAFLISYIVYLIIVFTIAKIRYNFYFGMPFLKLFAIQFTLIAVALLCVVLLGFPKAYLTGIIFLVFTVFYSYHEAQKRLDLSEALHKVRSRLFKKN